jgi:hypothetical protein
MYAGKDKEVVEMDNAQRTNAIEGLVSKAKSNRGEETDEQRNRANAVALLAGKQTAQKPVRPGVNQLLGRG